MPPLVVIVGETASGKSAIAMKLAEQFGGELICADSWTVYKGFDIGTAKPTVADQAAVAHHLLDIADPLTGFSAPQFQRRARSAIDDITKRRQLPIMVGGTGLYIDSVLFDYGFLKQSDPTQRKRLDDMELHALLQMAGERELDTTTIDVRNKRRVIRLIENDGIQPTRQHLRRSTLVLGIATDRDGLRKRIAERVDRMIALGLESEVATLAQRYGWEVEPMKGIGYGEWQEYFAGTQTRDETRERIIRDTMGLAKRQRTWFKRNSGIQWLNNPSEFVDSVTTFMNKNR